MPHNCSATAWLQATPPPATPSPGSASQYSNMIRMQAQSLGCDQGHGVSTGVAGVSGEGMQGVSDTQPDQAEVRSLACGLQSRQVLNVL